MNIQYEITDLFRYSSIIRVQYLQVTKKRDSEEDIKFENVYFFKFYDSKIQFVRDNTGD